MRHRNQHRRRPVWFEWAIVLLACAALVSRRAAAQVDELLVPRPGMLMRDERAREVVGDAGIVPQQSWGTLKGRFIYYVGPVDPVGDEVVGPAGPTTATRMDKFTRQILEQTGLLGMIGKSERGPTAIEAIKDNKAVYLMAVGGAAYLVAQAIRKSKVLAFAELGMEAIYEFEVKDMPVTVAVDSNGESVHITGPALWQSKIAESLAVEVK